MLRILLITDEGPNRSGLFDETSRRVRPGSTTTSYELGSRHRVFQPLGNAFPTWTFQARTLHFSPRAARLRDDFGRQTLRDGPWRWNLSRAHGKFSRDRLRGAPNRCYLAP